jgi:hypothetical protein
VPVGWHCGCGRRAGSELAVSDEQIEIEYQQIMWFVENILLQVIRAHPQQITWSVDFQSADSARSLPAHHQPQPQRQRVNPQPQPQLNLNLNLNLNHNNHNHKNDHNDENGPKRRMLRVVWALGEFFFHRIFLY